MLFVKGTENETIRGDDQKALLVRGFESNRAAEARVVELCLT